MRIKKYILSAMFTLSLTVLGACSNTNTAQNQSQSALESETITQTQSSTEAPTELDREIIPQDNVDKEIITLTEEQFKQFFAEDRVRIMYYFMNDTTISASYDELVKRYGMTKTVCFEGYRFSNTFEEIDRFGYEPAYDCRAYAIYESPYGGYLYVYFIKQENSENWIRSHAVYRENILSYEDFGDLTGKTAEDVEKIDSIVKYYREAPPETVFGDTTLWLSYHLLEDGILEIYYDSAKNNQITKVTYADDFIYVFGPYNTFDFILEE